MYLKRDNVKSIFDIPDVAAELADLNAKYVVVPAAKASNNTVFVFNTHHFNGVSLFKFW